LGRVPALLGGRAVLAAAGGTVRRAGAGRGPPRDHVTVDGVPLDEVHPGGAQRRPGVVVAHGFSGSARLMAPFGDTLAARGYVVVLLDFAGHGANTTPLPDDAAATGASVAALQHDLDVAIARLRSLPDVDPARIALVGHSMGATEVTRYAAAHPAVRATVALSLPGSSVAATDRPAHLLLLYGGLEFPGFKAAAADAVAHGGPDRRAAEVPGVEHISILYAPRAHRDTAGWLDRNLSGPTGSRPLPSPLRRITGTALLTLAFLAGLYPLARWMSGGERRSPRIDPTPSRPAPPGPDRAWPRLLGTGQIGTGQIGTGQIGTGQIGTGQIGTGQIGTGQIGTALIASVAAAGAVLLAPRLPTERLPIAIGGFIVGYTAVIGVVLTAYGMWRKPAPTPGPRIAGWRSAPLVAYAAAAIAVPTHLGLTHAVPVGARWWLIPVLWAGFALLAYGTERSVARGAGTPAGAGRAIGRHTVGVLGVSAIVVVALTGAAATGLTHGFVLLAVPPLVLLFGWQALWSAMLNRLGTPTWVIALTGSVVVAWPLGTALPLVG
jgi:dienelactone hydrolase